MIKKNEAEKAVRSLATKWFRETHLDIRDPAAAMPSFEVFLSWVRSHGYSQYLEFRSKAGSYDDVENWFDQELKQTWRN